MLLQAGSTGIAGGWGQNDWGYMCGCVGIGCEPWPRATNASWPATEIEQQATSVMFDKPPLTSSLSTTAFMPVLVVRIAYSGGVYIYAWHILTRELQ